MTGGVKRFALSAVERSGVVALARNLTARRPRILMYHNFCGETAATGRTSARMFRRQLLHLRRYYRPVRLRELAEQLAGGGVPPDRSVAITVDDGHANFVRFALPLLREAGIPATFFVISELSNSGDWLWTDKWEYACERAGAAPGGQRPTLTELRRMPAADRERSIDDFARRVGVRIPSRPPDSYELVSWQDLESLARSDLVDIGSHSRTHRILGDADDAESWDEIDGSRRDLERRLEVEIATFCFPNGLPADYRQSQLGMLARAGYACAVASHFGYVTEESNRFALPRIGGVFGDMTRFRRDLDGLEYLWRRIRGERPS